MEKEITKKSRVQSKEKSDGCGLCDKSCDINCYCICHTKEKSHTSEACGKSFNKEYTLAGHLNCFKSESTYSCEHGGQESSVQTSLRVHSRFHNAKPVACEVCGKSIGKKSLLGHLRIHTKEKAFKCEVCAKAFSDKRNLKKHFQIHLNEKPFACDLCRKAFRHASTLKIHLRTHTKEKPFKCDFCVKAFADQSHLKRHLRIHTEEKPHVCETCSKEFSRRDKLSSHLRIHTKD